MRLIVELDPAAKPVAGTIHGAPGTVRAFTGWTQLAHVLNAVMAEARDRPGDAAPPDGAIEGE